MPVVESTVNTFFSKNYLFIQNKNSCYFARQSAKNPNCDSRYCGKSASQFFYVIFLKSIRRWLQKMQQFYCACMVWQWYQELRRDGMSEKDASRQVSRWLGHERPDVTRIYLAGIRTNSKE
jgi:hypothetical protein